MASVVDFPQPDGPKREKNSPGASASEMPLTAAVSSNRLWMSISYSRAVIAIV